MSNARPDPHFLKHLIAKNLALPEDDPDRIEFETSHWIAGDDVVCKWQLCVQTGRDCWNVPWDEYKAALIEFCQQRLPQASCAAIARVSGADFARIYLEDLRRRAGSTIFGPTKKPDQAVVMLLENPDLTDEQIAALIPTTLKQLARFSTYNYLKREIRFAAEGIGG